jgi:hypothetical protein
MLLLLRELLLDRKFGKRALPALLRLLLHLRLYHRSDSVHAVWLCAVALSNRAAILGSDEACSCG